jgi:glutamate carboxypeptidase
VGRGNGCGTGGVCANAITAARTVDAARICMSEIIQTNALLRFCESQQDWLCGEIERLVSAESPSTDKAALDACSAALAERLVQLGGEVTRLPCADAGDHLHVEFGPGPAAGTPGSGRQVLLLGHFDTVWPVGHLARMPLRREGDHLFGPGVYDMKAGIGIALLAMRALAHVGWPPIRVLMLWTSDEEIGSGTSRQLIEERARQSDAVLVLEPSLPGGAVKTARKGVGQYELTVRGVSAHAGIDPGTGASAIHELARQILRIERLQDISQGISVNVGVIGGGSRPNVIAEEAYAHIDLRAATQADAERLDAALRTLAPAHPATSLDIRGGFERPPLERSEAVVRLYGLAKETAASLGRPLGEGSTGGASDGNFTAAIGVPTLDGLGAIGDGAHAATEHVQVAALPWRAALLAGLISRLAGLPAESR